MRKLFTLFLLLFLSFSSCHTYIQDKYDYTFEVTVWYLYQDKPETIYYTIKSVSNKEPFFQTWRSEGINCLKVESTFKRERIACYVRRYEVLLINKQLLYENQ